MDNNPREKLCELISKHGRGLLDDPRRCEGLLRDYCGDHRKEVNVLVSALKERVPADLQSSSAGTPVEILIARLTKRLENDLAISEDAAEWAVKSWALALALVNISDLVKSEQNGKNAATWTDERNAVDQVNLPPPGEPQPVETRNTTPGTRKKAGAVPKALLIVSIVAIVALTWYRLASYLKSQNPASKGIQSLPRTQTAHPPTILATLYVTGNSVRIHDRPSLRASVIGTVNWGDKLGAVGYDPSGQWAEIVPPGTSQSGWIARQFLSQTRRAAPAGNELLPVEVSFLKWGFVDRQGHIIIKPSFFFADRFIHGRALVEFGWGCGGNGPEAAGGCQSGYIDETGNLVSGNFAATHARNRKIGKGLCEVGDFSEGLASACICQEVQPGRFKAEKCGYINKVGSFVIAPRADWSVEMPFSEGLALIEDLSTPQHPVYFYIDKTGNYAMSQRYGSAGSFSEGLAPVGVGDSCDLAGPPDEGTITITGNPATAGCSFGFINHEGEFVLVPAYQRTGSFKEGLAPVAIGGLWGYISKSGQLAIRPQFTGAGDFSDGLACVHAGNGTTDFGYIDRAGNFVIQPKFMGCR